MILLENALDYENYIRLRQSVNWNCFSKEQTLLALQHSLYDVTAVNETETIAMGRLIGDGLYFMIVDVVVHPAFQKRKIGTAIMRKLLAYVEENTPPGGRSSVSLISEKGKEAFYESLGFKKIPHEFCGCGMRKVIYGEKRNA